MSNAITPENGLLKVVVSKLNIRKGGPTISAELSGSAAKGSSLRYIGYVTDGDSVRGNSKWYRLENGSYVWSGGVEVVSVDPPKSDLSISASVGVGGVNKKEDVTTVQTLLKEKNMELTVDGLYGNQTASSIKAFQKSALNFSNPDGRIDVGGKTWQGLTDPNVIYTKPTNSGNSGDFNTKYKDVIFQGSVFPDAPISTTKRVSLNSSMKNEYLPSLEIALAGEKKGLKLLCTVMASHEGFYPGSRSYRTNNPGNIGNTDAGSNVQISSLADGIKRQRDYINRVVQGKNAAYPIGKKKLLKSYYSPEIAKNPQYGLPAWLTGYEFVFTGQLDQFVKIYSTGARAGNSYLSTILSYLIANGIQVSPSSKIGDIIQMD